MTVTSNFSKQGSDGRKYRHFGHNFGTQKTQFFLDRGKINAVDGVNLTVKRGSTVGLVGESGCGKSITAMSIMRLIKEPPGKIVDGQILLHRNGGAKVVDIAKLDRTGPEMRQIRGGEISMIFQDPFSSLNPRFTVKDIIGEPLVIHNVAKGKAMEERVADLMTSVGLNPAYMRRYPHEFSGGQRQRIGLARTLSLSPRLIVADEPVSALDVSVQAQVLNLLQELKEKLGLTLLFIAHDLSVVEHVCDRIAVMYVGKIVELAEAEELLRQPLHPYTEALVSAVPPADPDIQFNRIPMPGEVPSPANPPPGCIFHPRCNYAKDICSQQEPPLAEIGPNHYAACHFAAELSLQGVGG